MSDYGNRKKISILREELEEVIRTHIKKYELTDNEIMSAVITIFMIHLAIAGNDLGLSMREDILNTLKKYGFKVENEYSTRIENIN